MYQPRPHATVGYFWTDLFCVIVYNFVIFT